MDATLELVVDGVHQRAVVADTPHVAAAAKSWLRGRDGAPRVVVGLCIDGCHVAADRLGNLEAIPLNGARHVEIETEATRQVALRGLESASEYAGRLASKLCDASEAFRGGRVEEGTLSVSEAADALSVLCFTVDAGIRALGSAGKELEGFVEELEPWLSAVANAHHEEDWIRTADYLEYEIVPRVEGLPKRIADFARGIEAVE